MFSIVAKNEPQTEGLKQALQICFSCPLDDQCDRRQVSRMHYAPVSTMMINDLMTIAKEKKKTQEEAHLKICLHFIEEEYVAVSWRNSQVQHMLQFVGFSDACL